jgi:hypothetical protein
MNIITKNPIARDPFEQSDRGGFCKNAGKGDSNRSCNSAFFRGYENSNLGKGKRTPGKTVYRYPSKG